MTPQGREELMARGGLPNEQDRHTGLIIEQSLSVDRSIRKPRRDRSKSADYRSGCPPWGLREGSFRSDPLDRNSVRWAEITIINDAKTLVHPVADTIYLVSPGVFQRYAQEHPRTAFLAKQAKLPLFGLMWHRAYSPSVGFGNRM